MSKEQIKKLIIVFIIVAVIVLVIWLLTKEKQKVVEEEVIPTEIQRRSSTNEFKEEDVVYRKMDLNSAKMETIARNFAERYGSWSNHNKDDNFKTLQAYLTDNMEQLLNVFITNTEELADDYTEYYGVSIKVLNIEILDLIENQSAELSLATQREETRGDIKNVSYQNLKLNLIKDNNNWLVNDAEWE